LDNFFHATPTHDEESQNLNAGDKLIQIDIFVEIFA
jgi:hypothetical protein